MSALGISISHATPGAVRALSKGQPVTAIDIRLLVPTELLGAYAEQEDLALELGEELARSIHELLPKREES